MKITIDDPIEFKLQKEMTEFYTRLGLRIKALREIQNISHTEYASMLDIQSQKLAKVESGKKRPSIKLLFKIESRFGVKEDWLITGRGKVFEKENQKELIEGEVQLLRMFNRLEDNGKKKMLNVIKVFLKSEHWGRQKVR